MLLPGIHPANSEMKGIQINIPQIIEEDPNQSSEGDSADIEDNEPVVTITSIIKN